MNSPHNTFVEQNCEALKSALVKMKKLGHATKEKIWANRRCRLRKEQFISVAILSEDEIVNYNTNHFDFYAKSLQAMLSCTSSIFLAGRMVTVLNEGNSACTYKHGEATVFGCQGHDVHSNHGPSCDSFLKSHIFKTLESMYTNHHHSLEKGVILMYSHFIPCTLDGHECARLLREFVQRTGLKLVIAYKEVFRNTSEEESFRHLNHDSIAIIQDKVFKLDYQCVRLNRPLPQSMHELWLFTRDCAQTYGPFPAHYDRTHPSTQARVNCLRISDLKMDYAQPLFFNVCSRHFI